MVNLWLFHKKNRLTFSWSLIFFLKIMSRKTNIIRMILTVSYILWCVNKGIYVGPFQQIRQNTGLPGILKSNCISSILHLAQEFPSFTKYKPNILILSNLSTGTSAEHRLMILESTAKRDHKARVWKSLNNTNGGHCCTDG